MQGIGALLNELKGLVGEFKNFKHQYRLQRLDTLTRRQAVALAMIQGSKLSEFDLTNQSRRTDLIDCAFKFADEFLENGKVKP